MFLEVQYLPPQAQTEEVTQFSHFAISKTRADQNTGGALFEFPMRTAMHGKSRVSSAISAMINKISKSAIINKISNFKLSTVALAQWVGVGVVVTGWCS